MTDISDKVEVPVEVQAEFAGLPENISVKEGPTADPLAIESIQKPAELLEEQVLSPDAADKIKDEGNHETQTQNNGVIKEDEIDEDKLLEEPEDTEAVDGHQSVDPIAHVPTPPTPDIPDLDQNPEPVVEEEEQKQDIVNNTETTIEEKPKPEEDLTKTENCNNSSISNLDVKEDITIENEKTIQESCPVETAVENSSADNKVKELQLQLKEENSLPEKVEVVKETVVETKAVVEIDKTVPETNNIIETDKEITVAKDTIETTVPIVTPPKPVIEPERTATVTTKPVPEKITTAIEKVIPEIEIKKTVLDQKTIVPLVEDTKVEVQEKEIKEKEGRGEVIQQEKQVDVEMKEVAPIEKIEPQEKPRPKSVQPVNGDVSKDEQPIKRRASEDLETENPLKRLCQEVEKTFPQHDTMINDYIQTATKNNIDELQRHTEQLLSEIQTLRELAQKKEHEWNNILHLKKVKEEILLRLLRRKQVLSFEKSAQSDINGPELGRMDPFDYFNQPKNLAIDKSDDISGLSLKQASPIMNPIMQAPIMPVTSHYNAMAGLPPPYDKAGHMQIPKPPMFPQQLMMPGPGMSGFPRDMNGQMQGGYGLPMGRQGPTKDVKSIIADYRQRNPDMVPRRGRRMKSVLNPNMMNPRPIAPKIDPMNSLNNLNMLFNNLDMNQKAMLERLQQIQAGGLPNGLSFKDVLVQFANMQQNPNMMGSRPPEPMNRPEHQVRPERRRPERIHEEAPSSSKQTERLASPSPRLPPPPPYPEISLLPVNTGQDTNQTSQNSLLHGILTKQATTASQSYSPTLAKLLTSPERKQTTPTLPTFGQAKNCGEITITPVQPAVPPQPEPQAEKPEEVVQLDDEESAASEGEPAGSPSGSGKLVIDEASAEETPLCQGCRRKDAQFVCAGCANQWYCSRDCQVAAWDDHSDMCSG